ncbi:nuclear transport factor 2 family protein [Polaromonas sp.]|uniref:nuclear transport factor 2 family protein n=1 Tax=Polaromonas sp. TaxID=1869339 RepID=UPI001DEC7BBD|nr:nuclear transport factor 2 family protein [Polaromonas sp.]MBT9475197.1 nuclear transport factor 2 family protein [Polaromonas sp.]
MNRITNTNKQVAAAFLQAIEDGDATALEALLAPSFHWWVAGWGDRTRAELLGALSRTMAAFPSRRLTTIGVTAEGERVAVEAEGRFERPGLVYANTYHYLFILQDGRITSGREYFDTAVARAAFGSPLPSPSQEGNHHEQ